MLLHCLADANLLLLHVPRQRLNTYGRRAFTIAGPSTWHSFPDPVRSPNSTDAAFRHLLKSFLFARYWRTQHITGVLLVNALYELTH